MDRKGLVCSVLLLLSLLLVFSAIRELQLINELRTIEFGHSYPRHGLKLLYWFAQQLTIHAHTDAISVGFNAGWNMTSIPLETQRGYSQQLITPHDSTLQWATSIQ